MELKNRHTVPRTEGRGVVVLQHTVAPCVICEPFFISNDGDLALGTRRRIRLASAYAAAIDEAASVFGP